MTVKFGPDLSYFLWSFAAGLCLALIYDIIRSFRTVLRMPDSVINMIDIVFVVFSAVVMVVGAYRINNGEFRVYGGVTTAGAFVLYNLAVGKRLANLIIKFFDLIIRAVRFVLRIFLIPMSLVRKLFLKVFNRNETATEEATEKQM